jgi:hypothetical protein
MDQETHRVNIFVRSIRVLLYDQSEQVPRQLWHMLSLLKSSRMVEKKRAHSGLRLDRDTAIEGNAEESRNAVA